MLDSAYVTALSRWTCRAPERGCTGQGGERDERRNGCPQITAAHTQLHQDKTNVSIHVHVSAYVHVLAQWGWVWVCVFGEGGGAWMEGLPLDIKFSFSLRE